MNRQNSYNRKRDRFFDKRLDQLIETGRQVVDGVAGNRPGKRPQKYLSSKSLSSFSNVGQWVENKLEWLLEDEEDWMEETFSSNTNTNSNYLGPKQPLEAISRRLPVNEFRDAFDDQSEPMPNEDEWPQDSTFQVDKWQRVDKNGNSNQIKESSKEKDFNLRPLPRSSRRRI